MCVYVCVCGCMLPSLLFHCVPDVTDTELQALPADGSVYDA